MGIEELEHFYTNIHLDSPPDSLSFSPSFSNTPLQRALSDSHTRPFSQKGNIKKTLSKHYSMPILKQILKTSSLSLFNNTTPRCIASLRLKARLLGSYIVQQKTLNLNFHFLG
jgi:hypothetical protein